MKPKLTRHKPSARSADRVGAASPLMTDFGMAKRCGGSAPIVAVDVDIAMR